MGRMVDRLYSRTVALIEEKKDLVEKLALRLLEKEVVQRDDLEEILGVRPFMTEALSNLEKFRKGFALSKTNSSKKSNSKKEKKDNSSSSSSSSEDMAGSIPAPVF